MSDGLVVRSLEVRYHGALALQGIDLDVPAGARVGVVGRNGAGKSTLLRAIAGAVAPSAGSVHWDGRDLRGLGADGRCRAGIAMVPEGRRVFAGLSVANNLRVGGFTAGHALASRMQEVFELFPILRDRQSQSAGQLSGGEAQMLAIGQAMMAGPRLLLLDEPSIGLAPIVVRDVLKTIRAVSERGITVLLVEQSVRLAASFADTLYALGGGRLVKVGERHEIDEEALRAAYLGT
jgi:branched-chain amino acid transport system ATP-binding protein